MSKDGKKGDCERRKLFRHLFACLLSLIILILFVILVIFLVLRPTKPNFSLQDTSIYNFNVSGDNPNLLSSTLQVTISSRNPNDRIGVYYDRLDVYASYKSQQITLPTAINPVYQGHNDVTVWSPFLYGVSVPVAPYVCVSITEDQTAGVILLHVRVVGKLRWKVGSWISGHYHIYVNCPAFLTIDGGGKAYHFQQIASCSVDV